MPKVMKRESKKQIPAREMKKQIPAKKLREWKLASFTGMYREMLQEEGMHEYVFRDAFKYGIGTDSTVATIDRFFEKRKKVAEKLARKNQK